MAVGDLSRPHVAGLLSGLLPGLGQFHNRQWLKGAGFLLSTVLLDAYIGLSQDMIQILLGPASALPSLTPDTLLLKLLPVFIIALWSVADAVHTARRRVPEPDLPATRRR